MFLEVIRGADATYFPYARQRRGGGFWEGAVDVVAESGKTIHVCSDFRADSAEAFIDAVVDALLLSEGKPTVHGQYRL